MDDDLIRDFKEVTYKHVEYRQGIKLTKKDMDTSLKLKMWDTLTDSNAWFMTHGRHVDPPSPSADEVVNDILKEMRECKQT